ncbi:hypothetical protein [Motilibacter deserti]|uniref:2TM domain-containing protein n=1 Tax=Motilibacter deserti TaxID=2714956 RepID=A0ABX0GVS3_9ACTN|nr:hypothetical protein [Motilibacter deserti]NHC14902.1 hypothetical protein [Motilibacter deserti]
MPAQRGAGPQGTATDGHQRALRWLLWGVLHVDVALVVALGWAFFSRDDGEGFWSAFVGALPFGLVLAAGFAGLDLYQYFRYGQLPWPVRRKERAER